MSDLKSVIISARKSYTKPFIQTGRISKLMTLRLSLEHYAKSKDFHLSLSYCIRKNR